MFATSRVFGALLTPAKSAAATSVAKNAAKSASKKASKDPGKPKKPSSGKPTGIRKPSPISPVLSDFLGGTPESSRADAVKYIWQHIKEKNLQNPENKKEIICDSKLKVIFDGKETVNFLEIGKLLSRHFIKTA